MIRDRLIAEADLRDFLPGHSLAGEAQALLLQQQATWEMARVGYKTLETVKTKAFDFDGIVVHAQFNPGRMRSTTAKVDDRSIAERPCFLCNANLPPEQKGILYRNDYLLLVNPFPIFPEHFTIAHVQHRPQRILSNIEIFLDIAHDLAPQFVAVYNGPRCGASAPDHMHFQAGTRSFLPLVDEYQTSRERFGRLLADTGNLRAYSVDRYLPAYIALESPSLDALTDGFEVLYRTLQSLLGTNDEPMINLLSWYDEGEWRLVAFPRSIHRPARYFAEGDQRILMSPAAIDLGGVAVLPVREDFERIQAEDIEEIFEEVILAPEVFRDVTGALSEAAF